MVSELYVVFHWQFIKDVVDARALNFVCVCVRACGNWFGWVGVSVFFISKILIAYFISCDRFPVHNLRAHLAKARSAFLSVK